MKENTLYIFIDESGELNFNKNGSKYFVLTSLSTLNPLSERDELSLLRYKLLGEGKETEYFHATEDLQEVRDLVYERIKPLSDFEIDSIVAEKSKTGRSLFEEISVGEGKSGDLQLKKEKVEERFYRLLCTTLLKYVCTRYVRFRRTQNIVKIIVILDNLFTKKKRDYVTKAVKTQVKELFNMVPFVYFHHSKSDINSQICDYCSWAIYVKWSREEKRPFENIANKIKSEFEIFRDGKGRH